MNDVFISICIPAYKRVDFLKRLLDSIAVQTYQDFEVIVTDDSSENEVKELCGQYRSLFPLFYYKNEKNLNTPENWNEAIRKARGQWIKLIHDDDWFNDNKSLETFANTIQRNPGHSFFFSAYKNIYEDTGRMRTMVLKPFWKNQLVKNPNILIAQNVVGPPSVTVHRNDKKVWYDNRMKYVVDIDFYISCLGEDEPFYIDQPLINVGINSAQVTKYTHGVAEVHLYESLLLLEKTGENHLRNIVVFDGWWRLLRNFRMRNKEDLRNIGYNGVVPGILKKIMDFQKNIPHSMLRMGLVSKLLMSLCYLRNKNSIPASTA